MPAKQPRKPASPGPKSAQAPPDSALDATMGGGELDSEMEAVGNSAKAQAVAGTPGGHLRIPAILSSPVVRLRVCHSKPKVRPLLA
jgi:hypothetical protein